MYREIVIKEVKTSEDQRFQNTYKNADTSKSRSFGIFIKGAKAS